jgi:putative addiction module component (TIGR02574 family)
VSSRTLAEPSARACLHLVVCQNTRMSFQEVLAELPALSVEERQFLVRRALELDDSPLSEADEVGIDRRRTAHRQSPGSALSLEDMKSRIRSRLDP